MMVVIGLLGALLVVVGVLLMFRARHGARLVLEVWRRPTTAIASIAPGVVELSGTIAAQGEPIAGLLKSDCVAVRTQLIGFSGEGKERKRLGGRSALRVAPALLRDSSGTCLVDLKDAELVGERLQSEISPREALQDDLPPWAKDLLPPLATHILIEEVAVPSSSSVMVTAVTQKQEKNSALYRDGGARWVVGGTEGQRVLLTLGGQEELFRRSGGAVLLAIASGFCMVAQGIALILVGIWL